MIDGVDFFDISPLISRKLGVFPGDVGFRRDRSLDVEAGDGLTLSSIQTTLHLGAHADAPNHYAKGKVGIAARSLGYYLGLAQVATVDPVAPEPVGRTHFASDFRLQAPRLLLKTGTFPDPENWNSNFSGIEPDLIDWLASEKTKTIGIDTPSIDHESSKTLSAHARVAAHDMAILEGLILSSVPDGLYFLIALPLKIEDADASPVRALLLNRSYARTLVSAP